MRFVDRGKSGRGREMERVMGKGRGGEEREAAVGESKSKHWPCPENGFRAADCILCPAANEGSRLYIPQKMYSLNVA